MTTSSNNSMLAMVQDSIEAKAREAMEYGATEYAHDIESAKKSAKKERDSDVRQGAKNAQPNTGKGKGRTTRTKLTDSVNVSEMMKTKVSTTDERTVEELCESIKETHAQLQAGQIDQLSAYASQGNDLATIKRQLLTQLQLDDSNAKKADIAFGKKLKESGIGDDVIARQARGMYIWLADNETEARAFVETAIATEKEKRTKEQKKVVNAHARIGLTPYVIMSAMTESETKAEKSAMDTAKAHIKQVMKDLAKRKGKNKFDFDSADADEKILEQAKALLENALAEINV